MYCDCAPQVFLLGMVATFLLGYITARHYVWSKKTNELIRIHSIKTEQGNKRI